MIPAPRLTAVVYERLLDLDRIAAPRKPEPLLDGYAGLVHPRQRYHDLIRITQHIFAAGRTENRILVRARTVRAAQAGSYQAQVASFGAKKLDQLVRPVFFDRVAEYRCPHERAAARRDLRLQHIGANSDDRALACRICRLAAGQHGPRSLRLVFGRPELRQSQLFVGRRFCRCLAIRRLLYLHGSGPVILHPGLVGQPEQNAERGPYQQSLIVHPLLFLPAFAAVFPATSSPVTGQAVKQLLPGCRRCCRLVDHDDVEAGQLGLVLPE